MKKFLAILLSAMLMLSLAVPTMAAGVTNATSDHTYDAYQVFSGTQADGGVVLGDIVWGSGVNGNDLLDDLKEKYNYFDGCTTAADVADVLKNTEDGNEMANALAEVAVNNLRDVKTTIVPAETVVLAAGYWLIVDTTNVDGKYDAKNAALLQVTNDGTIEIKKKYDTPSVEKEVDDPDANIGDTVTFTLTAIMPSNLEGYDTYKVIFHDTLSVGLTYTNTVKVTIDGAEKTSAFTPKYENGTLTVSCDDVLALGAEESSKIVVTYTAVLNKSAVIAGEGNPNTVYLEYSNDPNWDGTGDKEPTGNTPNDTVYVFTWEIPVVKIDSDTDAFLAGAIFGLYKDANCTQAVNLVAADNNIYKVCTLTDEEHTSVEGVDHIVADHVTQITTDTTGKFNIEGLEKGTYYMKEIQAPAGYNLLTSPIIVMIGEGGALTQNSTATDDVTIENNAGATLPETGGIGTTIFYIVGGLLAVGAAVLLITKKRMSAEG